MSRQTPNKRIEVSSIDGTMVVISVPRHVNTNDKRFIKTANAVARMLQAAYDQIAVERRRITH